MFFSEIFIKNIILQSHRKNVNSDGVACILLTFFRDWNNGLLNSEKKQLTLDLKTGIKKMKLIFESANKSSPNKCSHITPENQRKSASSAFPISVN
jgi:hypothetical protein